MSSKISENGISILESIPNEIGKRCNAETDVTLQIYSTIKTEQKNNNVYSVTMMDMHQKYSGFLMKYSQGEKPNVGDIINILSVSIAFLNKDKTKIYYLKNYKTLAKKMPFVISPENLDNYSKKKLTEKEKEKKNENDYYNENYSEDKKKCLPKYQKMEYQY